MECLKYFTSTCIKTIWKSGMPCTCILQGGTLAKIAHWSSGQLWIQGILIVWMVPLKYHHVYFNDIFKQAVVRIPKGTKIWVFIPFLCLLANKHCTCVRFFFWNLLILSLGNEVIEERKNPYLPLLVATTITSQTNCHTWPVSLG